MKIRLATIRATKYRITTVANRFMRKSREVSEGIRSFKIPKPSLSTISLPKIALPKLKKLSIPNIFSSKATLLEINEPLLPKTRLSRNSKPLPKIPKDNKFLLRVFSFSFPKLTLPKSLFNRSETTVNNTIICEETLRDLWEKECSKSSLPDWPELPEIPSWPELSSLPELCEWCAPKPKSRKCVSWADRPMDEEEEKKKQIEDAEMLGFYDIC